MAEYPESGSLVESRINTGLSTQILVKVETVTVGAIQQLKINQTRNIKKWEEIGTDGIVDSHPMNAAQVSLSVERVVFDDLRMTESFGRGFINLQSQRIPFDIQIINRATDNNGRDIVMHVFKTCWFNTDSPTYTANNFIIKENANIVCERVYSVRDSGNVALGGLRGIDYDIDTIERTTDRTARPGRFDSSGQSITT